MVTDDDVRTKSQPAKLLDTLSIEELHEHVSELKHEIEDVIQMIERKMKAQEAASAFFGKPKK